MPRVGLLGCGNIGRIVARKREGVEIVAVFDEVSERAQEVAEILETAQCYTNFDTFIADDFEIAVEAASIGAVTAFGEAILQRGKDLIVLSVGAFADASFRRHLEDTAEALGRTIRIPSGALFGLDNIKIGQVSEFDQVLLRTTKKPASLGLELKQRTLLFQGGASDCIKLYPRNVNIAVSLSLAAGTEVAVELWADPAADRNSHEVILSGEFGSAKLATFNLPCPDNPATSYLAALSILTLLKLEGRSFRIGT